MSLCATLRHRHEQKKASFHLSKGNLTDFCWDKSGRSFDFSFFFSRQWQSNSYYLIYEITFDYLWKGLIKVVAAASNWFLSLKADVEDAGLEKAHRHAHGLNQLHCFADPTVSWDVVDHYQFEWWKNGDTQIGSSQNLIEYQEKLSKPPGLVLTLGKIEVIIYLFFLGKKCTLAHHRKIIELWNVLF